jgi:hypothetical protein
MDRIFMARLDWREGSPRIRRSRYNLGDAVNTHPSARKIQPWLVPSPFWSIAKDIHLDFRKRGRSHSSNGILLGYAKAQRALDIK